jgi:hypothetical protein
MFTGSNGISPLLFNAGLVSHYRRYLNPVDPRMFVTNDNISELNKSDSKGELKIILKTQLSKDFWSIFFIIDPLRNIFVC